MSDAEHSQDHRDLWAAINAQREGTQRIELALARVETKLNERCGLCVKTQAEHGERIDELETAQSERKGGWTMLTAVGAAILAAVSTVVQVFK